MTTTATARSEAKTEQTQEKTHVNDVTYVHDSIVIREVIHDGGDTVEVTRWHTRGRDRLVHERSDTVRITDTLEEEKTVEVPKEGGKAGWTVAVVLALVMIFQTVIKTTLKR